MGRDTQVSTTKGRARSAKELAKLLGISQQAIVKWVAKGLPQSPDGTWDVFLCRRWIDENRTLAGGHGRRQVTAAVRAAVTQLPDLDDSAAVSRWLSAKGRTQVDLRRLKDALAAKQTQLELQERQGLLVYREAVGAQLRLHLAAIRTNVEAIPANAARSIAAALGVAVEQVPRVQECIRREVEVAMRTLAADPLGATHGGDPDAGG